MLKILFLFFITSLISQILADFCQKLNSCEECIQEPNCAWCSQPKNQIFCMEFSNATTKPWCDSDQIIYPLNQVKKLSSENWHLNLRKKKPLTVHYNYIHARDYPLDLYFLMDLSYSMLPHKNKLAELGETLAKEIGKTTSDLRLGFGSFVDKETLPYGQKDKKDYCSNCTEMYGFKNHLSLSSDFKTFTQKVANARISGNIDSPEGGFDGLMQALVCGAQIGWRKNSRKIIVFSSDVFYHIAGDGKLGGVVEPNDANCYLNNNTYTKGLQFDYPSVSQLNAIANKQKIYIIFAIVKLNYKTMLDQYKELSQAIKMSKLGFLDQNSNNIISLITEHYRDIQDSVVFTHNSSNDFNIQITAHCKNQIENGCSNITSKDQIDFQFEITANNCTEAPQNILLQSSSKNQLILTLETLCSCDCSKEFNSPKCSSEGTLSCGTCLCPSNRYGANCECDQNTLLNNTSSCSKFPGDSICSGQGTCKCNQCLCYKRPLESEKIQGKYCECSNFGCPKSNGKLCSGNGQCNCNKCECFAGWTGESCDCSTNLCLAPGNAISCSGRGACNCGQCTCEKNYFGKYCEQCASCATEKCKELSTCVVDQIIFKKTPSESCNFTVKLWKKQEEQVEHCTSDIPRDDCKITYYYKYVGNELKVYAKEELICPEATDPLLWIVGVSATILLGGILLLVFWKIFITIQDQREFARFKRQQFFSSWQTDENPLYINPRTSFTNPLFGRGSLFSRKSLKL